MQEIAPLAMFPRKSLFTRVVAGATVFAFLTSTLLTPVAQAGFWEERRQSAASERTGSSTRVAQAPLSGVLPVGDKVLHGFNAQLQSLYEEKALTTTQKQLPGWMKGLVTPFGQVEDFLLTSGFDPQKKPLVVILQDVHNHLEAQQNLSQLLASYQDHFNLRLVGLEGARGAFKFDRFRSFSDKKAWRWASELLLENKIIGGPEFFGLTSPKASAFWGVETESAYLANVKAFRDTVPHRDAAKTYEAALDIRLSDVKAQIFNDALKALDQAAEAYAKDAMGLDAYLARVADAAGESEVSRRPNVQLFLKVAALEKAVDFSLAQAERDKMIRALASRLSAPEVDHLLALSLDARLKRLSLSEYFTRLEKVFASHGLAMKSYPALASYVDYARLADGLRKDLLFDEITSLEEAAGRRLAQTAEQKEVLSLARDARLLKKLLHHGLTTDEWRLFQARREAVSRLNDRLGLLGATALPPFPGEMAVYEAFYRNAMDRNDHLLNNLLKQLDAVGPASTDGKPALAVLVVGGFHTAGLKEIMARRGLSHAVVTPVLTNVDGAANALDVFVNPPTNLERAMLGEKVFLQHHLGSAEKPMEGFEHTGLLLDRSAETLYAALHGRELNLNEPSALEAEIRRELGADLTVDRAPEINILITRMTIRNGGGNPIDVYVVPKGIPAEDLSKSSFYAAIEEDLKKKDLSVLPAEGENPWFVIIKPAGSKTQLGRIDRKVLAGLFAVSASPALAVPFLKLVTSNNKIMFFLAIASFVSLGVGFSITRYFLRRSVRPKQVVITPQEIGLAEDYWKGNLKTSPIERPFRASRKEDVKDVNEQSPEEAREIERLAVESVNDGEGTVVMLMAGASSRMNTQEAQGVEDVREMLGGKKIQSKAAVPVGRNEKGKVVSYLGAFAENVARLFSSVETEARRSRRESKVWKNDVLLLSNDSYRPEHDALLRENRNFGLKAVRFYHQPLGAKFVGTPAEVEKLKSKFSTEEDYKAALDYSIKAQEQYAQGNKKALIIPDERDPWGHGEALHQLVISGELLRILKAKKKWISFRNVDNVAAKYDKAWLRTLGLFLQKNLDMQPEVSPRSPGQKGGSLLVMEDTDTHQLAEDPNIAETNKVNKDKPGYKPVNPTDSYWFNDAVAIFSPAFIIDLYKRDGQTDDEFLVELDSAGKKGLEDIADRGRRKFPKILDPKPAKDMKAVAVKAETNMWQSSGVVRADKDVSAVGVRGVRNIDIEAYKKMSWEEKKEVLGSLRFLAAKQWTKTEADFKKARKELEEQLGRPVTDDEFMATQETYVGNKLLAQDLIRYIEEAELVTPGILGGDTKQPLKGSQGGFSALMVPVTLVLGVVGLAFSKAAGSLASAIIPSDALALVTPTFMASYGPILAILVLGGFAAGITRLSLTKSNQSPEAKAINDLTNLLPVQRRLALLSEDGASRRQIRNRDWSEDKGYMALLALFAGKELGLDPNNFPDIPAAEYHTALELMEAARHLNATDPQWLGNNFGAYAHAVLGILHKQGASPEVISAAMAGIMAQRKAFAPPSTKHGAAAEALSGKVDEMARSRGESLTDKNDLRTGWRTKEPQTVTSMTFELPSVHDKPTIDVLAGQVRDALVRGHRIVFIKTPTSSEQVLPALKAAIMGMTVPVFGDSAAEMDRMEKQVLDLSDPVVYGKMVNALGLMTLEGAHRASRELLGLSADQPFNTSVATFGNQAMWDLRVPEELKGRIQLLILDALGHITQKLPLLDEELKALETLNYQA
jgi:hypothetical protein